MKAIFHSMVAFVLCSLTSLCAQTPAEAFLATGVKSASASKTLLSPDRDTDPRAQALIARVEQVLRKVQSLTARVNITDTMLPNADGNKAPSTFEKISGSIAFKRPNLFRFEQRDSAGKITSSDVLDGKTLWTVYPSVPQLNRRLAPATIEGAFSRQGNPLLKYVVLRTQDLADTAEEVYGY